MIKYLEYEKKNFFQVYIVGHTPPGTDDRESGTMGLTDEHNARYLKLVREYADMIRGQFFGHWHSDAFRVVYSDNGERSIVFFFTLQARAFDKNVITIFNNYAQSSR